MEDIEGWAGPFWKGHVPSDHDCAIADREIDLLLAACERAS
jgi:hypothetical protein